MKLGFNVKIVYSGEKNIEIYHYSKPIVLGRVTNETGKNKDGAGDKENIKRTSLHNTRTKLMRLINSNKWNYFITLTYAEDFEIKDTKKHLQNLFKQLRRSYGKVEYVYVHELTKRGRVHHHVLMQIDIGVIEDMRDYERFFHKRYWKYGWVKIKPITSDKPIAGYLCKYLTKDLCIDTDCNKYGRSRDLKEPVEVRMFNTEYLEALKDLNMEVQYTNSYQINYENTNNTVTYISGVLKENENENK